MVYDDGTSPRSDDDHRLDALDALAAEIADFAVVPFVGAGASLRLTAGADWNAVTALMNDALLLPPTDDGPAVAQTYADRFGRDALVTLLRERLTIPRFDDELGASHLALMCLHFPAIYTTNVENAIELCHAKYGRRLNVVAKLQDLRGVLPGSTILYKYHGDLLAPDTIVWTTSDYSARRDDRDFFLNIRLRSDLLTKRLFFVGYSVRDPHVVELLARAQSLYGPGVRGGTVIVAGDAPAFAAKLRDASLAFDVIDPRGLFPDEPDVDAAINRTLQELLNRVVGLRTQRAMESLFTPRTPEPTPLLSPVELFALEKTTPRLPLPDAVKSFRVHCDRRLIPKDIQERVVTLVARFIGRARQEGMIDFRGLLLNLQLDPVHAVSIVMHAYTLYAAGFSLPLHVNGVDEKRPSKLLYLAGAFLLLREAGEAIGPAFTEWISRGSFGSDDLESLPPDQRSKLRALFEEIFEGSPRTNPLSRPYPIARLPEMTFDDFHSTFMSAMPGSRNVPFEG